MGLLQGSRDPWSTLDLVPRRNLRGSALRAVPLCVSHLKSAQDASLLLPKRMVAAMARSLEEHNCGVMCVETTRPVGSAAIVPKKLLFVVTKQAENALNCIVSKSTMV